MSDKKLAWRQRRATLDRMGEDPVPAALGAFRARGRQLAALREEQLLLAFLGTSQGTASSNRTLTCPTCD